MLVVDSVVRIYLEASKEFVRINSVSHATCFLFLLQVPGGPAHKHLETGDVLVRINGEVSQKNSPTGSR